MELLSNEPELYLMDLDQFLEPVPLLESAPLMDLAPLQELVPLLKLVPSLELALQMNSTK